jgi:3-ketosteroid 9alpha-monooxygenase subunit A
MTDNSILVAPDLPEQKDPSSSNFPDGWHYVANSKDLEKSKAIEVINFATQIVVWRGSDEKLYALDMYCKHMGASLGCGEVDQNGIRCPFHAWRWNGSGDCDDIPYAKRVPDKAKTRSWTPYEKDGKIYVWFDRNGNEPDFDSI